jgi:hypothetical protein
MRSMIFVTVAALVVAGVALMAKPGVSRDAAVSTGPAMLSIMELTLLAKDLPNQVIQDPI